MYILHVEQEEMDHQIKNVQGEAWLHWNKTKNPVYKVGYPSTKF